ncbi:hypothetical protein PMAYCL1PPCAC_09899, partial [Pristionchus mayeri]
VLADAAVGRVDLGHKHLPAPHFHFHSELALRESHHARLEHLHRLRILQLRLRHIGLGGGERGGRALDHE